MYKILDVNVGTAMYSYRAEMSLSMVALVLPNFGACTAGAVSTYGGRRDVDRSNGRSQPTLRRCTAVPGHTSQNTSELQLIERDADVSVHVSERVELPRHVVRGNRDLGRVPSLPCVAHCCQIQDKDTDSVADWSRVEACCGCSRQCWLTIQQRLGRSA